MRYLVIFLFSFCKNFMSAAEALPITSMKETKITSQLQLKNALYNLKDEKEIHTAIISYFHETKGGYKGIETLIMRTVQDKTLSITRRLRILAVLPKEQSRLKSLVGLMYEQPVFEGEAVLKAAYRLSNTISFETIKKLFIPNVYFPEEQGVDSEKEKLPVYIWFAIAKAYSRAFFTELYPDQDKRPFTILWFSMLEQTRSQHEPLDLQARIAFEKPLYLWLPKISRHIEEIAEEEKEFHELVIYAINQQANSLFFQNLEDLDETQVAGLFESVDNFNNGIYSCLNVNGEPKRAISLETFVSGVSETLNALLNDTRANLLIELGLFKDTEESRNKAKEEGLLQTFPQETQITLKGTAKLLHSLEYLRGNLSAYDENAEPAVPMFEYPEIIQQTVENAKQPEDKKSVEGWKAYFQDRIEVDLSGKNLNDEELTAISKALEGQKNIRDLDLSRNNFTTLPAGFLKDMPHLVTLDLSQNSFSGIEEFTKWELDALREVDLSHNRIEEMPDGLGAKWPKIEALYLHNNKLQALSADFFTGFKTLEHLDISKNQVSRIEPLETFLSQCNAFVTLTLDNNLDNKEDVDGNEALQERVETIEWIN